MGVMQVDPRDTTQECSSCHHIKTGGERLTLNDRIYHCNLCDLTMDRDLNASINIRNRALASKKSNSEDKALRGRAGLARTDGNVNAQGDICLYNANGIASSVEELRTYPAGAGEAPTFR
jgi:transposase